MGFQACVSGRSPGEDGLLLVMEGGHWEEC